MAYRTALSSNPLWIRKEDITQKYCMDCEAKKEEASILSGGCCMCGADATICEDMIDPFCGDCFSNNKTYK
jgi:hypothetical protein